VDAEAETTTTTGEIRPFYRSASSQKDKANIAGGMTASQARRVKVPIDTMPNYDP
jgi:hypothetical protein